MHSVIFAENDELNFIKRLRGAIITTFSEFMPDLHTQYIILFFFSRQIGRMKKTVFVKIPVLKELIEMEESFYMSIF